MSRHLTIESDGSTITSDYINVSSTPLHTGNLPLSTFTIAIDYGDETFQAVAGDIPQEWRENAELAVITIGSRVKNIGDYAFFSAMGSSVRNRLKLPNTLKTIGTEAFSGRSFIASNPFVIPGSVTHIGDGAFSYSYNTNVYSNASAGFAITTIGEPLQISTGAFIGCTRFIGNLVIPQRVTSISSNVFDGCNFTNVYLDVDASVFTGSDALSNVPGSYLYVQSGKISGYGTIGTSGFQGYAGTLQEWTSYPNLMP